MYSINDFFQTVAISPSHKVLKSFVLILIYLMVLPLISIQLQNSNCCLSWMSVRLLALMVCVLDSYLKEIAKVIVPSLTTLYNESLREGIIPSAWKQSNIFFFAELYKRVYIFLNSH